MFTGIIQGLGSINSLNDGLYKVSTNLNLKDCKEGSSISCNGVCLTAKNITFNNEMYNFDVNIGEETLKRTNLEKYVMENKKINIEKSLCLGDEIGGHFVYGHVDNVTTLKKIVNFNNSWEFDFEKSFKDNNKFIAEKASIAVNGISLTIANVADDFFTISVIEHTFSQTNFQYMTKGDIVNIEFDYFARFIFNEKQ